MNNCLLDDNTEPNFQVRDLSVSLPPASLPPPASVLEHPLVSYSPTSCPPELVPPPEKRLIQGVPTVKK